jgi:hypothetical protein
MYLLVTEERYSALFCMLLYTFLLSLLNILIQTANKMGQCQLVTYALSFHVVSSFEVFGHNSIHLFISL